MGPSLAVSKQPGSLGWFVFSSIVGSGHSACLPIQREPDGFEECCKRDPGCRRPGWDGYTSQAVEKGVTSLCTDRETEVQSESSYEHVVRANAATSGVGITLWGEGECYAH